VVGSPSAGETRALLATLHETYRPNIIAALTTEDLDHEHPIPLLSYRTMRGGRPTVYVCRHFACQMPVTTPDEVRGLLK
jgi:uncharacterized protein YyaL (SSP411 family)